jgi:hypothetical protein
MGGLNRCPNGAMVDFDTFVEGKESCVGKIVVVVVYRECRKGGSVELIYAQVVAA